MGSDLRVSLLQMGDQVVARKIAGQNQAYQKGFQGNIRRNWLIQSFLQYLPACLSNSIDFPRGFVLARDHLNSHPVIFQ